MIENRSVPAATVIPVLSYEGVEEASAWLCDTFGFRERLRIGDHRIQLRVGEGAVILASRPVNQGSHSCHSVLVRIADVDSHYAHAQQHGARITQPPESFPLGERQYSAEDPSGHIWTFSQSIADVDPAAWGGTAVDLG